MTAIIAAACLTACSETDNNPVNPDSQQTIKAPDTTEPTDDQLAVLINGDMPAAVLSSFDDKSVGAALVRRMSETSATVTDDTKLVLLKGSDNKLSDKELSKLGQLYNRGGYVAIEKPTVAEAIAFALALALVSMDEFQVDLAKSIVVEGKDEYLARRQQTDSPLARKLQSRVYNAAAATRAADMNDVVAEVFVISANGYFVQAPYENQVCSSNQTDEEGNESEPTHVVHEANYSQYQSGLMADAVAEWLNSQNSDDEPADGQSQALTRSAGDAINSLMNCADEFTYNCSLPWVNASHYLFNNPNRVTERYLIWGAHNFKTNTDYYYVEQKTTLRMGGRGKYDNTCIYWGPEPTRTWYDATNFKGSSGQVYDNYYGSWLHKYETSINITGIGGQIQLEEALPYTDNTEGSKSIAIGTFESTTDVVGVMGGVSIGEQPSIDIGGYYEYGVSRGTNFTLSTTSTKKEFPVTKNTEGTKVTWTYEAPDYLEPHYYYDKGDCHSECPDILCNDANTQNSICWSVKNPVGNYTLNLTSHRKTRCLVMNKKYHTNWNAWSDKSYTHRLTEPNRALQNWYMDISVDETEGQPAYNIKGTLIDNIQRSFPKTYTNEFTIADKSATSTDMIESIVNAQAKVFNSQKRTLEEHAKSLYIKKFTIRWTSDSPELSRVVYKYEVNAQ